METYHLSQPTMILSYGFESFNDIQLLVRTWNSGLQMMTFGLKSYLESQLNLSLDLSASPNSGKALFQCQNTKPVISGFFLQDMFDELQHIKYVSICNDQVTVQNTIMDFIPNNIHLIASSNGLICCRNFGIGAQLVFICNPLKREFLEIKGPKGINEHKLRGLGFVFDPQCYSLDGTPSFKLVSISKRKSSVFSFHIYSSEERKWRLSEEICYDDCDLSLGGRGIFAGGVVYWLTVGSVVIAFDLEKGNSKCINLPVPRIHRNEGLCEMCIGESVGCLHYILITDADLRVWVLNGEHGWLLKHSISLTAIQEEYPNFFYNEGRLASAIVVSGLILPTWIEPISFKDGNLLIKLRCCLRYGRRGVDVSTKIYLYNFDAGTVKELCALEDLGLPIGYLRTIPYSMSFAPLLST
ncbi:hypothetical protein FRX31_003627 [Thalictrum thalictroides]|uniref:F-box protein At3g26010-like beta-propeller domain-containing protein n=1 Tax=Thalictrum thalictroides TaxID=46969 RepID=A0A7J6XCX0_THATH|nr:hypothetical protein FRX31_003627 [Thalictrum thalictroides]